MIHRGTVELVTDRLVLRRFTFGDDIDMFNNWTSDEGVARYLKWMPHRSLGETQQVLHNFVTGYERLDSYMWAIVLRDTGTVIGSISAVDQDNKIRMVRIGYCIGTKWWHMGYTSEALIRLVRFFFEEVGVNRIEAHHDPRNINSGKVMQKAGLQCEGTHREADWNNLGICDMVCYAILAKDYFG